ncbi:metallopeptidase family protein [Lacisediminihabitans changchengi]|uniref:Metallopeptidase family protein n=1 Tax=Lacisediminihabitans changchengi TaxID=2787634 RepID=A0A934SQQ5_9MICO|nr:metallopeptidase family protein [Lacisediminihabitans changchengi]MBK4346424.1 metallopeptidase family protein [Lacisediminihabitans changchengi]
MPRDSARSSRTGDRDRHGRGLRSPVTGPDLPPLHSRAELFDLIVGSTAEYLKDIWPDELATATFEVAALPAQIGAGDGIDRWQVDPVARRVTLYRLPIERLARSQRGDETQRRMMIESCVFRAVAELLGKDPWDLAPERFRHL